MKKIIKKVDVLDIIHCIKVAITNLFAFMRCCSISNKMNYRPGFVPKNYSSWLLCLYYIEKKLVFPTLLSRVCVIEIFRERVCVFVWYPYESVFVHSAVLQCVNNISNGGVQRGDHTTQYPARPEYQLFVL